jgi:hypothetical protein
MKRERETETDRDRQTDRQRIYNTGREIGIKIDLKNRKRVRERHRK